ncbi:MAG: SpoIIE family protein phosphatase [Candidatus Wallbacteria bacterium]|nr:SpoIIE family protein phosphatase [Candidatus Wallbacteria bacterium]
MATKNTCKISELNQKIKRLSSLIRISALLNSTLDLDKILNIIMRSAKKVMMAEAATLFLYDEVSGKLNAEIAYGRVSHKIKGKITIELGQGIAGWVGENRKPLVVSDTSKDSRFFSNVDRETGFITRSVACVPLVYQKRLIGVAQVLNKKKGGFTEEDVEVFSTFANQAAIALENAKLHNETLKVQLIEQELNLAQLIQNSFLPRIEDNLCEECDVGIMKKGAFNVSGDFFDIFHVNQKKQFFIFGDISGKGIPAAIFMANLVSKIRYLVYRYQELSDFVSCLNNEIHQTSQRGMFTTLVAGFIDLEKRQIQFMNCGHLPLGYFQSKKHRWELLSTQQNIPLGILPDTLFHSEKIEFEKGDMILMFSDGVTEARNRKGKEFGLRKLCSLLPKRNFTSQEMVEKIYSELLIFCQSEHFHDDVTLFALSNCLKPDFCKLNIVSSATTVRDLRATIENFLRRNGLPEMTVARIVLAVDEAISNIIKYSYQNRSMMPIELTLTALKHKIEFQIRDFGVPVDTAKLKLKDLNDVSPGGLGLNFIYQIMDEVNFNPLDTGTELLMTKYI